MEDEGDTTSRQARVELERKAEGRGSPDCVAARETDLSEGGMPSESRQSSVGEEFDREVDRLERRQLGDAPDERDDHATQRRLVGLEVALFLHEIEVVELEPELAVNRTRVRVRGKDAGTRGQ